jgi:hypothetical protein
MPATLYGSDVPPQIDLTDATIRTVALATAGQTTMSGVQPKISVGWPGAPQDAHITPPTAAATS